MVGLPLRRAALIPFLAGFLHEYVAIEVQSVDALDLEYEGEGELHPSVLLGETGGSRGIGQTSPDLGVLINQGRGLVLVENKLVEKSFYECSAQSASDTRGRPGNPDPSRCDNALAVATDPPSLRPRGLQPIR